MMNLIKPITLEDISNELSLNTHDSGIHKDSMLYIHLYSLITLYIVLIHFTLAYENRTMLFPRWRCPFGIPRLDLWLQSILCELH